MSALVQKLLDLAAMAYEPEHIPHVIAVVRLLGPLHLPDLARSWQPPKESDDDLPPLQPILGHDAGP